MHKEEAKAWKPVLVTEARWYEYFRGLTVWGNKRLPGRGKAVEFAALIKAVQALKFLYLLDEKLLKTWWKSGKRVPPEDFLRDTYKPADMLPDSLRYNHTQAVDNFKTVPWGGLTTQYCSLYCKELPVATLNPGLAVAGKKIVNTVQELVHPRGIGVLKLADPDEEVDLLALKGQHATDAELKYHSAYVEMFDVLG